MGAVLGRMHARSLSLNALPVPASADPIGRGTQALLPGEPASSAPLFLPLLPGPALSPHLRHPVFARLTLNSSPFLCQGFDVARIKSQQEHVMAMLFGGRDLLGDEFPRFDIQRVELGNRT